LVSIVCSFLPLQTVIDALLVTRILVQFIGQVFAVFLLRRRAPEMPRPYRIWLYPLPPLMALAGWLVLFCSAALAFEKYAGLTLPLGLALFAGWSLRTRQWPFAVPGGRESAAPTITR